MGKNAPQAPPPPDPNVTAQAQTQSNVQTAIANALLNRIDQETPWGSIKYTVDGYDPLPGAAGDTSQSGSYGGAVSGGGVSPYGIPRYKQTVTLSPEQQALLDAQNRQNQQVNDIASGYMDRIQSVMGKPFSLEGLPDLSADYSADRRRVEDAIMSRYNDQFTRQEDDLRTRLANQGVMQGTEAYAREMDALNRARNDAQMQAIIGGGQEQTRLFDLGLRTRQQGMQEQSYLRSLPLNEFNSLRAATPVQQPSFQGIEPVAMQGTPIGDYIMQGYGQQVDLYNAQLAGQNSMMNGLFSLGGTLGAAALKRK